MSIVPASRALVLLTLVSLAATAWAQEVRFPPKPDPESFYVDMASVVAEVEGKEINEVARTLLQEERMPLLVVTIPSLTEYGAAGYTIERYATALFNEWGIGSEQRNYGMLLLVAVGDRKARIELGAGWETTGTRRGLRTGPRLCSGPSGEASMTSGSCRSSRVKSGCCSKAHSPTTCPYGHRTASGWCSDQTDRDRMRPGEYQQRARLSS